MIQEPPPPPAKKQRFSSLKNHFRRPSVSSQVEGAPLVQDPVAPTGRVASVVLEEERRALEAAQLQQEEARDRGEHDAQGGQGEPQHFPSSEKEKRSPLSGKSSPTSIIVGW